MLLGAAGEMQCLEITQDVSQAHRILEVLRKNRSGQCLLAGLLLFILGVLWSGSCSSKDSVWVCVCDIFGRIGSSTLVQMMPTMMVIIPWTVIVVSRSGSNVYGVGLRLPQEALTAVRFRYRSSAVHLLHISNAQHYDQSYPDFLHRLSPRVQIATCHPPEASKPALMLHQGKTWMKQNSKRTRDLPTPSPLPNGTFAISTTPRAPEM